MYSWQRTKTILPHGILQSSHKSLNFLQMSIHCENEISSGKNVFVEIQCAVYSERKLYLLLTTEAADSLVLCPCSSQLWARNPVREQKCELIE